MLVTLSFLSSEEKLYILMLCLQLDTDGDSGPVPVGLYLAPLCFLSLHSKESLKYSRARTGSSGLGSDF